MGIDCKKFNWLIFSIFFRSAKYIFIRQENLNFNRQESQRLHLTHSHTMTTFDAPGKQAF